MANEKRLIDANAFQFEPDPVDNIMNGVLFLGRSTGKTLQQVKYCLKAMIDNAPTVDAVEVVHGRWIPINTIDKWRYQCDQCKHYVDAGTDRNYCPNCGAKMDGDGNG